jgi:hypothetical protein
MVAASQVEADQIAGKVGVGLNHDMPDLARSDTSASSREPAALG